MTLRQWEWICASFISETETNRIPLHRTRVNKWTMTTSITHTHTHTHGLLGLRPRWLHSFMPLILLDSCQRLDFHNWRHKDDRRDGGSESRVLDCTLLQRISHSLSTVSFSFVELSTWELSCGLKENSNAWACAFTPTSRGVTHLFLRGHECVCVWGGGVVMWHTAATIALMFLCFINVFLFIWNIPKRINYIMKY